MKKIWQKNSTQGINSLIEDYTVGIDYLLDMELISYDIIGSKAHVKMLNKISVLTDSEKNSLLQGLDEIGELVKKGDFTILKSEEDCHTAIESYLTEKYPNIGTKVHTGRSRNDQILVTTRLFTIDKVSKIIESIETLINSFENKIKEVGDTKMPGYTHMQKAMPSSVGMWLGSIHDSLQDDLLLVKTALEINNQNPLGSVAGFGENVFGLDKEFTAKELGFKKVQSNPMYASYSRGKFEHIILQALSQVMMDLGKFASDMVLFGTKEFDYFTLPDEFKTGSSVMPQKKNWDVMELVRGNSNLFQGYEYQVKEIFKNLLSGYNRDFQLTKEPYLKGIKLTEDTVKICNLVINNLGVNKSKLELACSEELYATEEAYKLVKAGVSFRNAYKIVGEKYL
ncbi:MAG: argininosuccinate lyase [Candidatus Gracilibacteria bacterium]